MMAEEDILLIAFNLWYDGGGDNGRSWSNMKCYESRSIRRVSVVKNMGINEKLPSMVR